MKDVAIKVFKQYDAGLPNSAAELTRNYSDMRYELNKLSTLRHPFIVVFVGVLTNPHCFVLEWAPLGSLEGLRGEHYDKGISFCPTSLLLVLLQVRHTHTLFKLPVHVHFVSTLTSAPCTQHIHT